MRLDDGTRDIFRRSAGLWRVRRPSKPCGSAAGLLGKPIRGTMMLKLAAIWGMPEEPAMPRATYFHEITLEDVPEGQPLLDLSIRHRIPHLHQCGGSGRCTNCRVQMLAGLSHVSPPGGGEQQGASR